MERNRIGAMTFLAGLLLLMSPRPSADAVATAARRYCAAHQSEILRDFAELLAIPNVASDTAGIGRNVEAIRDRLVRRGLTARLLDGAGGPPLVLATLEAPGATRTLMIYAHYDGQPVDAAQWAGSPWTPLLRDKPLEAGGAPLALDPLPGPAQPEWRLYARSAGDDKAPIVGVLTALDALRQARLPLSLNLKLLFEGEEEAGSPHLAAALATHRDLLGADLLLLCDGPVHQSRRMQVVFGARGVTDVELTVYGPLRALHSGHYGNWAPNPAVLLAHIVADLRDPDGQILIPGFYDDVRPVTAAEQAALERFPDPDAELRDSLALAATEAGNARLAERVLLPALNVRGLLAGGVGVAAANAIPTEARASIDFRLVPNQTPGRVRELFEAALRRQGFFLVETTPDAETRRLHSRVVQLHWGAGYPAARTPLDLPVARRLVDVIEEGLGGPVVVAPTLGGSIPMYLFAEILKQPVILLPIANHDDNQHAANENLRLQNLWDGIEVYAAVLARLGGW